MEATTHIRRNITELQYKLNPNKSVVTKVPHILDHMQLTFSWGTGVF